MADYKEIDQARKTLAIGEEATLVEIREAYRRLAMECHPDRCQDEDKKKCEEMFRKINDAYKTLLEYCANYKFVFKQHEVENASKGRKYEEYTDQFYDDWIKS